MENWKNHSPLPWVKDYGNTSGHIKCVSPSYDGTPTVCRYDHNLAAISIPNDEIEANGEFIVEACNNYESTKAENKRLREALEYAKGRIVLLEGYTDGKCDPTYMSIINKALEEK